jgi:hypothetical protein
MSKLGNIDAHCFRQTILRGFEFSEREQHAFVLQRCSTCGCVQLYAAQSD